MTSAAGLKMLNSKSEVSRRDQALLTNITAARGLQEVLRTNLGPKGTLKMLVSGAGDLKLTKDGNVLLHEMHISHPVAALIARAATAVDDIIGDGTTSAVLLIGELMRQAEIALAEGVHPRALTDGFDLARRKCIELLNEIKIDVDPEDRDLLMNVARTSLRSKIRPELADMLTDICVDALLTIRVPGKPIDLFMVEIMTMQHRTDLDSRLVKGLVLDHGARHPDMPKRLANAYILTCNVSLEYEKSEHNAVLMYGDAAQRQQLIEAERRWVDDRVRKIIDFKKTVCDTPDKSFVIINQKGIDPMSLDLLAKAGIFALRRAKRRNMERMTKACGGHPVNSVDDLSPDVLGFAGLVYEHALGEEKYTFVEEVKSPFSVTILLKGPTSHAIAQLKDAVRDGLRAVNNVFVDKAVIPGGGAFELALHQALTKYNDTEVKGKAKIGVKAVAEAVLVIPKTLAANSGLDVLATLLTLQQEHREGHMVGLDLDTGDPMDPALEGVYDNKRAKAQSLHSCLVLCQQLCLVDSLIAAGHK